MSPTITFRAFLRDVGLMGILRAATNTPRILERSSYLRRAATYLDLLLRCDWYQEPSLNLYTEYVVISFVPFLVMHSVHPDLLSPCSV